MSGVSYQVFARKYRPQTFDDVLGQDHVVRTLKNAIEQKRLAHAYLFVGPRGTGKTSTARIFAKALNCPHGPSVDFDPNDPVCVEIAEGRSLDVLEIDGASNNGVEQVRDLRDNVQFAPSSGQFRIFYIDEVHMLSKPAFNALLKTLEEPPPHVKFIFATTEAHKILPTILSRCQRFDLRPIGAETIAKHLLYIASKEGVDLSPEAAFAVAKAADGGMRDAQSMLDQLVSFCGTKIEESHVLDIFGITSRETVGQVIACMLARQISPLLQKINEQAESGRDLMQFLGEMIFGLREVLVSKVDPSVRLDSISPALLDSIEQSTARMDTAKLLRVIEILAETEERMKWATNKRLHMEIGLIKAVHSLSEANISDIIRALDGAPLVDIKSAPDQPPATIPVTTGEIHAARPASEAPVRISEKTVAEPSSAPTAPVSPKEPVVSEPAPAPAPTKEDVPEEKATLVQEQESVAEEKTLREEPVPYQEEEQSEETPVPDSKEQEPDRTASEPPTATLPTPGEDFFAEISGDIPKPAAPAPSTPLSFLDDAPVRPIEHEPEDEEEALPPIDENTMSLFGDMPPAAEEETESRTADAELWTAILIHLEETSPLKHLSIEHTIFLGHEGPKFIVGVHPNDLMARDVLLSNDIREKIEAFLLDRTGETLLLTVQATEEAPMPEEEDLEPLPLPLPKPSPPKERKPSPEELKQREQALASERDAAKAKALEEFYNDPLIQDALDIFHAKIAQ